MEPVVTDHVDDLSSLASDFVESAEALVTAYETDPDASLTDLISDLKDELTSF